MIMVLYLIHNFESRYCAVTVFSEPSLHSIKTSSKYTWNVRFDYAVLEPPWKDVEKFRRQFMRVFGGLHD